MKRTHSHTHIVADGRRRAYISNLHRVQAEVANEFSTALESAGLWRRIVLWFRLRREVERRMSRIAPPGALYSQANGRP